ncbi:MAG: FAD-binding and (Fe-S)-binding domain-containing protein [Nitrospiria bacterium]
MLLAEFDECVPERMAQLRSGMQAYRLCGSISEAYDPENQAALWKARKAVNPALYQYDAVKKPIHFVDDVVVPVDQISALISFLEKQFSDKGVKVAIYGHVGNGNAHINPLMNLNDSEDFAKMISLYREIHEAVIGKFKGSLCGEHGDGRVRAGFLKELYGPELYALFKDVKKHFDPKNVLNPGVKISDVSFTEKIDYERYSKPCATCGKCNSVCPVYDIAGEESNAARGWYHILTSPDYSYKNSSRVVEACLNCKSCRTVCPAGIDVSQLVLKKREEHPNSLARAFFSLMAKERLFNSLLKGAAWTQTLWDNKIGRFVLECLSIPLLKRLSPTARIPSAMVLPRLAKRFLRERYSELTVSKNSVAYFHGCAGNYFDDEVGNSIISLLRKKGVGFDLPPQRCSGTPIQTYGLSDQVKECARFNLRSLSRYEKVITGCASCTFMLKDYQSIFTAGEEHHEAVKLSSKVLHISEFLIKELKMRPDRSSEQNKSKKKAPCGSCDSPPGLVASDLPQAGLVTGKKRVTYHSSCHLRAAGVSREPWELLRLNPNFTVVDAADSERCAGGAGTFCIKNPKLSASIFKRKEQGILQSGADIVATSCPACMVQLKSGLKGKGIEVKHIAELL